MIKNYFKKNLVNKIRRNQNYMLLGLILWINQEIKDKIQLCINCKLCDHKNKNKMIEKRAFQQFLKTLTYINGLIEMNMIKGILMTKKTGFYIIIKLNEKE